MSLRLHRSAVAMILLAVGGASLRGQEVSDESASSRRGWLEGIVVSDAGVPLEGAHVDVDGNFAISGADGRFRLEGLEEGAVLALTVWLEGWHSPRRRNAPEWRPVVSTRDEYLTLVLHRYKQLRGWVRDPEGRPIQGAQVTASDNREAATVTVYGFLETTHGDGVFAIGVPPRGDYDVYARAEGFLPARARRILQEGSSEPPPIIFVLEPATGGQERARSPRGEPSPGEELQFDRCPETTSAEAAAPMSGISREAIDRRSAPGSIRGRLPGIDGTPHSGEIVASPLPPHSNAATSTAEIASDGSFRFDELEAGFWHLLAYRGGVGDDRYYEIASKVVRLDAETEVELTLQQPPRAVSLRGRVTGSVAIGETIGAVGIDVDDTAISEIDAAGDFWLESLHPGKYLVRVGFWHEPLRSVEVEVLGDLALQIDVPDPISSLSGVLSEAATGQPVAQAELELRFAESVPPSGKWDHDYPIARARSDVFGRFFFDDLAAGTYDLWVEASGHGSRRLRLDVGVGAERVDIVLTPEAPRGLCVLGALRSSSRVDVHAFDGDRRRVVSRSYVPDSRGRIELQGLSPGEWDLLLDAGAHGGRAQARIAVPGETTTVRLQPAGYLNVHVPALSGRGLRVPIRLEEKTGGRFKPAPGFSEPVLLDDWALIGPIAPGSWRVRIESPAGIFVGVADVAPGEVEILELR